MAPSAFYSFSFLTLILALTVVPTVATRANTQKKKWTCRGWLEKKVQCQLANGAKHNDDLSQMIEVPFYEAGMIDNVCKGKIQNVLNCMEEPMAYASLHKLKNCTGSLFVIVNQDIIALTDAKYNCGPGKTSVKKNHDCLSRYVSTTTDVRRCADETGKGTAEEYMKSHNLNVFRRYNNEYYLCLAGLLRQCSAGASQHILDTKWHHEQHAWKKLFSGATLSQPLSFVITALAAALTLTAQ